MNKHFKAPKQVAKVVTEKGSTSVSSFAIFDGAEYYVGGFGLGSAPGTIKLAERLARAIDAGVVYSNLKLMDGVPNEYRKEPFKYVSSTCNVMGRRLNADLHKLGF